MIEPLKLTRTQGEINEDSERWLEAYERERRRRLWTKAFEQGNIVIYRKNPEAR